MLQGLFQGRFLEIWDLYLLGCINMKRLWVRLQTYEYTLHACAHIHVHVSIHVWVCVCESERPIWETKRSLFQYVMVLPVPQSCLVWLFSRFCKQNIFSVKIPKNWGQTSKWAFQIKVTDRHFSHKVQTSESWVVCSCLGMPLLSCWDSSRRSFALLSSRT